MAVTPTGFVSLPMANLKESLAQCAAFRTFVGAESVAAARALIYQLDVVDPASIDRPYAVVGLGEINGEKIAGGAQNVFSASGAPMFILVADVNTALPHDDQVLTMTNALGAIVVQLAQNTGAYGYFSFDQFTISAKLTNDDKYPDEGPMVEGLCVFPYDGSPIE